MSFLCLWSSVQVDNKVSLFKFHTANVRAVQVPDDTNVWFVAKDVTDALGIKNGRSNIQRAVDDEDIQKVSLNDYSVCGVAKCDAQIMTNDNMIREMTIINESGVYALVFSSRLKKAKEFKRWVTSEVLPTILRSHLINIHTQTIYIRTPHITTGALCFSLWM